MIYCKKQAVRTLKKGYSLIEILIGITIVGTLIGGVMYLASTLMKSAAESTTNQNMQIIRMRLEKFYSDKGEYPNDLNEMIAEGYIEKPMPKDGWKRPFVYEKKDENADHPFELYSKGSDRKSRISVWKK